MNSFTPILREKQQNGGGVQTKTTTKKLNKNTTTPATKTGTTKDVKNYQPLLQQKTRNGNQNYQNQQMLRHTCGLENEAMPLT